MNKKITKSVSTNINTGTKPDKNLVIYGFDRITLWLDIPELPIEERLLEKHCKIKTYVKLMDYGTRWKIKIDLFQPTDKCLEILQESLGQNVTALLTYVEIACDVCNTKTEILRDEFLAKARMKYKSQTVENYETVWYYGRRSEDRKSANLLTVYADKPSKLNNKQIKKSNAPPCLHIEWRANGSATLEKIGIVCLADLRQFNHEQFWNNHVPMYSLPKKQVDLGRLLAKYCGTDHNVSGSALRKRATKWKSDKSIDDVFVMHNALLNTRNFAEKFNRSLFTDWIKTIVHL